MWTLRTLTLAAHLLCVNLAAAGPLICIWLDCMGRRRQHSDLWATAVTKMALASLLALQAGVVFGLLSAGWLYHQQNTAYLDAFLRVQSRALWGVAEIAFSLVCLLTYFAWARYGRREARWQRVVHRTLAVATATNLLYHFPPLFAILSELAQLPDQPGKVSSADFRDWLMEPLVIAKSLHVWGASLAVAGIFCAVVAPRFPEEQYKNGLNPIRSGGICWCLLATTTQLFSGMGIIMYLPNTAQFQLTGGSLGDTALLVVSVLLTFRLMQQSVSPAFGRATSREANLLMGHVVLVVVLMTGTLLQIQTRAPG